MSRIYDNWVKLVEAVVRREKDRQLAYCESISSCCSSDFSSRFSLDHHLQDAAPLGDDACLAGDTLPPPNSKVYGFADLKIATRSFIVSISMHHVLKRPQSRSGLIKPPTSKHDVENFPLQHGSLAPPKRYKFHELEKITRSFDEKLGEGGYGRVYKGKLGDGRPVAVKVFGAKVASTKKLRYIVLITLWAKEMCHMLKKWLLVLILSMLVYVYVAAAAPSPSPSPTTTPAYAPSPQYHEWPPADYRDAEHGIDRRIVIVIVVASTVVAIILVSIKTHCFLKRRRRSLIKPPNSKHDVESFLLQHGSLAPKRYKFCELKKITRSFGEKLGEGGYGSVYKGKLGDGRPVAVKVLAKVDSSSGEDFINEVASISRTSHVNIVTLLGFCYEGNKRALVYEFMPNTSLDKFLNQSAAPTMDLEKLFKIALGTAKGLEYLHTGCTTRIVHFDIKPQNILLDEDFCPKISDFGLAKLCKKKQSIISISELGPRGTVGYIAPEVFIRNIGRVSHKSDVYSYGMMLLKMAQAHKVVESDQSEAEVTSQSSEDYFPDSVYAQIIRYVGFDESSLVIEDEERETITKMCVVGFWCIQTNPSTRPSISKVVEMLEGSLNSIPIPPKPMLCDPQPLPPSTFSENSSQYD